MDPPAPQLPARRGRPTAAIVATAIVLVGVVLIAGGLLGGTTPTPSPTDGPTASSTDGGPTTSDDASPTDGASGPATPSGPPPTPFPTTSVGYLVTPAELADRVARAARGEQPYADAQADVIADAEVALKGTRTQPPP